jgi:hypothetical protein
MKVWQAHTDPWTAPGPLGLPSDDDARDEHVRKLLAWLEGASVPEAQIVAAGFNHTLAKGADAEFRGDVVQSGERIITVYPARLLNLGRSCKLVQRCSHAKGLRRRACTTSGEVVTKFQSDSSRTDSPVRILYAQPRSRSPRALHKWRLSRNSSQIARGRNRRFESYMPSHPVVSG